MTRIGTSYGPGPVAELDGGGDKDEYVEDRKEELNPCVRAKGPGNIKDAIC